MLIFYDMTTIEFNSVDQALKFEEFYMIQWRWIVLCLSNAGCSARPHSISAYWVRMHRHNASQDKGRQEWQDNDPTLPPSLALTPLPLMRTTNYCARHDSSFVDGVFIPRGPAQSLVEKIAYLRAASQSQVGQLFEGRCREKLTVAPGSYW